MSHLIVESERRVSPIELFFDLVFAFAFTQVTTFWLDQPTWGGFGRGLIVLTVLWWVWASFAWLTNAADAEAGPVLAVMLAATAALFVAALAVPTAFGAHRFVFAVALFAILSGFVGLYAVVGKGEPDLLGAVLRMARMVLPAGALILAGAFAPSGWRPLLWVLALAVGFIGAGLVGLGGWRVHPAHFAERHGLIVIIAIGESLGAIGFGARETNLDARVIVVAILGMLSAASFWMAYFDFASGGVRDRLEGLRGVERVAFARDAYTYAHLLMVTGIILFAFAMRTTVAHVRSELATIPALALCCGPALYLFAFSAIRMRLGRGIGRGRPTAMVAFMALTPVAVFVPAFVAVALVTMVWLGLHAYELIWWRAERVRRRSRGPSEQALIDT